ncbi:MAG: hypothetical protein ACYDAY_08430 [Candidatus Dormibacteria bacterium]
MRTIAERQDDYYRDVPMVRYDLVRELAVATVVVLVLVLGLSAALSSPDAPPVTIQQWAQADPIDFVTTAVAELEGSSPSAGYGPPYNAGSGAVQSLGPLSPQQWLGVHIAINPARDFVLQPLRYAATGDARLTLALATYNAATPDRQAKWLDSYAKALGAAQVQDGLVTVQDGDYGPVPVMMAGLLDEGRSGAVDGYLLNSGRFFQTDYTAPLLFMADGGYLASLAKDQHLQGSQWGMMNETGLYPGQTWLWLYTLWYQLPAFQAGGWFAANADLVVVLIMTVLTLLLALVPFIPVLRDIPHWIPVHRLIWRHPPPVS